MSDLDELKLHTDYCETTDQLIDKVQNSFANIRASTAYLNEADYEVPYLETINPISWELGHASFFFDINLRNLFFCENFLLENTDTIFNSHLIPHKHRWQMTRPDLGRVLRYQNEVEESVCELLSRETSSPVMTYLTLLSVYHQDMHAEALLMTKQTLGYEHDLAVLGEAEVYQEMISVPSGEYQLGASRDQPFVYDNEKWAHPVKIDSFEISKYPISNINFSEFVEDGGYERDEWWSYGGRLFLEESAAIHPRFWRRNGDSWENQRFGQWLPLDANDPVCNLNFYEAEAFASWAGMRLPTEAEWELAATGFDKKSVSAFGCENLFDQVWEWTSSDFLPFPGFELDFPYRQYSCTSFGYHKVLRGGSFASSARMLRPTWRNFYLPHRNDIFAGFRVVKSDV